MLLLLIALWAPHTDALPGQDAVYDISADQVEIELSARCPQGDVVLQRPTMRGSGGTLQGNRLELCLPDGKAQGTALSWRSPQGTLHTETLTLEGAQVRATGVTATRCACAHPPWRLTASTADVDLAQGAWLSWPVLWAGPVPVATAPRWYLPFSDRQSGFLLPRLGYDAEEGAYGSMPIFFTLGEGADVTLSPGWRGDLGPSLGTRLRWASTFEDSGQLDLLALSDGHVQVEGDGVARWAPFSLTTEGVLSSSRALYAMSHPDWRARQRDHLYGTIGAVLGEGDLLIGVQSSHLTDLRQPGGRLTDQPATYQVRPALWARWMQLTGPVRLNLDGRFARLSRPGGADTDRIDRADLQISGELPFWWGPLAFRPTFGALSAHAGTAEGNTASRTTGHVALETTAKLRRRFPWGSHTFALTAFGRLSDELVGGDAELRTLSAEPALGALKSRRGGAQLGQTLRAGTWRWQLAAIQAYEQADPVADFEPLLLFTDVSGPWLQIQAQGSGPDAVYAQGRLGPATGHHLRATWIRFTETAEAVHPWLRTLSVANGGLYASGLGVPVRTLTDARIPGTLSPGASLSFGRWQLSYDAGLTALDDGSGMTFLGHQGRLAHQGRCDCWSAALVANHDRGRPWPDLWLSVALY
ncbi:MAG: hypothetical protein ACE366_25525 [Bradymonadia bacterium]